MKIEKEKILDLYQFTKQKEDYICEYCEIPMLEYHDIKGERITTGQLFQCGKCGIILDTSMDKIKRPVSLTTNALGIPTLENIPFDIKPKKKKQFDIDPQHDEWIKAQGGKIVHSRIVVDGRVVSETRSE